jgi:ribose-phosphate pyrophosphokinase
VTGLLFFSLPGNEAMAEKLGAALSGELGKLETRRFPDEETYLRFATDPAGRSVVLVCSLNRPDPKFLRLAFAASAAKELGAARVGLVAPYLAYMRQDKQFHPGEAVSSVHFARLVSVGLDWLVTVDPHLHRHKSLDEIFPIPARVGHAAPLLAGWITSHVQRPLVIGPDSESQQWVSAVAELSDAPYRVLRKERRGDREVAITVPDLGEVADRVPVLVDDIISSGRTMIETVRHLREQGLPPAVCLAVHAVFSEETLGKLKEIAATVVTTNSIPHSSNGIDLAPIIARSVGDLV